MQALIERLEQLTGPDREVDVKIYTAIWPAYEPGRVVGELWYSAGGDPFTCPKFTASIDAALTLYRRRPEMVPSDPIRACIEALRVRQ